MIKFTALNYKLKLEALEKHHNIAQLGEGMIFDWESSLETAKSIGSEYLPQPFIEPFEFEDEDYEVTEKKLRVRKKDIVFYRENADDLVEMVLKGDKAFVIKESIEEIDKIFGL